ncbi:MAG: leucine-rich repeat domain-containing protein [Oscillospiraceae bacterium]|nr:leucine-rich repeat domain-containing protein [Oscillospiraceae bacterium]
MKRTLKRILPILLAIVVICSIIWYLFVYDRDFTRDMLLRQARYFESKGNHSAAAWLYNQAYLQAEENEGVAIELAEQFKAIGNYTKAEYTLTNAIANGGSAELYIALCKTYVEQDKLLDAVAMLDNITDPAIKAQLDKLRPEPPAVSHEPGFYSQYITVTIESIDGTLYITADGEYPSTENGPSDGSVTLAGGENTIYALTVGENGLVSPLAIYGYTVGGVIEEVTLADNTIDTLVRQTLGISEDALLYSNDLWQITSLTIPEGADSYEDLKWLPYLESLTIRDSSADGLGIIGSLSHLTELTLTECLISAQDLQAIASAAKLSKLTMSGCKLSGIEGLSGAGQLAYLDLSNNSIRDISALSFMSGLRYLDLSHNALTDLNALSSLSSLETLDVSYNSLSSITPLSSCTGLQTLNISNNTIAALNGINNLTGLSVLYAGYNGLTDISPLSACADLTELDISSNSLTDIGPLASLSKLQNLNFSRNEVTTLPAWSKNCALIYIDGSYNSLTTISGLAGYANLNYVLMDYNKISSVNALSTCPNLIKVSVYGNPVKNVSALTDQSIIVNYTP